MGNRFSHHLQWLIFMPGLLFALPQDGTVASGSADFSQPDLNTLLISTSDKAIINYQSFDIGSHEIRHEGVITAKAGHVVLAAAQAVTLDFTGDGLIHFVVEGELKEALIEQAGKIEAADSKVHLRLKSAKRVIESIINCNGISEG